MVRKFFCQRFGNGKGIHNVSWNIINEGKTKGGLGIKNLSNVKHSLLAKHLFKLLNNEDVIWVNILSLEYGNINFWTDHAPGKCSWFFHYLYNAASHIKPYCRIKSFNPHSTFIFQDPWCFDIPIALKPTLLNMNVDAEQLSLMDLVQDGQWKHDNLNQVFGFDHALDSLNFVSIDCDSSNHWIWYAKIGKYNLSAAVYQHLNQSPHEQDRWKVGCSFGKLSLHRVLSIFFGLLFMVGCLLLISYIF